VGSIRPIHERGSEDGLGTAFSLAFDSSGSKIVCGYDKCIRIFDLNTPGRTCSSHPTYTKKSRRGVKGIISSFDFHPTEPDLFACGSYGKCIGLFSLNTGKFQFRLEGQSGGVTSVKFTPCGTRLFSAARKDDEILCYDIRNLGQILFVLKRPMTTNQRIQFDIDSDGRYLFSGDTDGIINVWDFEKFEENCFNEDGSLPAILRFKAHGETIGGTSLHPHLPLLATSSGERRFMEPVDGDCHSDSSDDDDNDDGGDSVDEDCSDGVANETAASILSPEKQLRKDPVWRRVVPSAINNSLKIWQFK